jgi:pseudouridine synthase
MKERLQKLMAMAGVASRRSSEDMIRAGRVRVNGRVAHIGDSADLKIDKIEVDGSRLRLPEKHIYIAVNKARNVLTAGSQRADDERRTVRELIPHKGHLFSVGRLDADSEGLVVLTNDGDLAQQLSHPRYRHTKTYRVVVKGLPTSDTIQRWENGIHLEEGRTLPCHVKVISGNAKESVLKIVMTEGKKRQIRRVASILGHPVRRLQRVAIGRLTLGELKLGQWRELTDEDVKLMRTPATEIRFLRRRRPSRPANATAEEPEAPQPRGTGKDDDVRSSRQRRYARGEGDADGRRMHDDRSAGKPRESQKRVASSEPDKHDSVQRKPPRGARIDPDDAQGGRPASRMRRTPAGSRTQRRNPAASTGGGRRKPLRQQPSRKRGGSR